MKTETLDDAAQTHVVFFSGGIGSYITAKRVIQEHGPAQTVLLFTDTLIEDKDLYRFLGDAELVLGVPITRLQDGRTPWEVYKDKRFLGNSRLAPCSHALKQDVARSHITSSYDAASTYLYLGLDWTEQHRFTAPRKAWTPYPVRFPLSAPPYLTKEMMLAECREAGLEPPRLYALGFSHNNCGGFCCRAGQGHFAHLLKALPEVYRDAELREAEVMQHIGTTATILRSRKGGVSRSLSLRQLREQLESGMDADPTDIGGCGCFVDTSTTQSG